MSHACEPRAGLIHRLSLPNLDWRLSGYNFINSPPASQSPIQTVRQPVSPPFKQSANQPVPHSNSPPARQSPIQTVRQPDSPPFKQSAGQTVPHSNSPPASQPVPRSNSLPARQSYSNRPPVRQSRTKTVRQSDSPPLKKSASQTFPHSNSPPAR